MTTATAQIQELFALKGNHDSFVGHYDDPAILELHAKKLNAEGYHIYTTINPVSLEFVCRINEPPVRGSRANNKHIARRCVLPYDIDTIRPEGQAATDEERKLARAAAVKVVSYWRERGVYPEIIDSGNGYQVRVPIDLPNDPKITSTIKNVLQAHKKEFQTEGVKFDILADAPRIMRLPGYINWKGEGTAERPHRQTKLLNKGSGLATYEMLEAVCLNAPPPEPSEKSDKTMGAADLDALDAMKMAYRKRGELEDILGLGLQFRGDHTTILSMAGFLFNNWENGKENEKERLIEALEKAWDDYGTSSDGPRRPNEVEEIVDNVFRRKRTYIKEDPDCVIEDAIQRHAQETDWEDVLTGATEKGPDDWKGLFHTYQESLDAPPITFAIDGFLQEGGATMLGGLPGHGKTLVALAMVRALLEGSPLFGYFNVPRKSNRVVYLIPESGLTPFVSRLRTFRILEHVKDERLYYRTFSKDGDILQLTNPRLMKACEGADVFLDTAVRFIEGDENASSDQKAFAKNLFDLLRAGAKTVTGLHHSPKGSEKADYMSLENILRGSGELGAMLSACWGIRQVDYQKNRLYVKNVKARDFQPCEEFIIEARPHLDDSGYFKMTESPGIAGSLNDNKPRSSGERKSGRPESPEKTQKMARILELHANGRGSREIADEVGVPFRTVCRWLVENQKSEPASDQNPEP
jgi:AAA domain-containing protein